MMGLDSVKDEGIAEDMGIGGSRNVVTDEAVSVEDEVETRQFVEEACDMASTLVSESS